MTKYFPRRNCLKVIIHIIFLYYLFPLLFMLLCTFFVCHDAIFTIALQQILHTHLMPAHFYLHFASYFNSKYRKILHEYYTIKVTTKMTRTWSELTWCERIWNLFTFKKHLPMWINVKFNFEFYHKFDYNFFSFLYRNSTLYF